MSNDNLTWMELFLAIAGGCAIYICLLSILIVCVFINWVWYGHFTFLTDKISQSNTVLQLHLVKNDIGAE